ncbi:MAG: hypothetical protein KDC26_00640 [Armatimonadetes bacterium]|nr:hypothetical protein [Armatimonadota bacterium]
MRRTALGVGSVLAAALAHLPCCGAPILLASGGFFAGASWLQALEPYRNWFIALSVIQIVVGFILAYRKPTCAVHGAASRRKRIIGAWSVACLSCFFLALPTMPFFPKHDHEHSAASNAR